VGIGYKDHMSGANEHGSEQTRAAHPGLRKKKITPNTCLKFCIVLKKGKKMFDE
jgi:hypothetical protein